MNVKKQAFLPWLLFVLYAAGMLVLLFDRDMIVEGLTYREQLEQNLNLEPLHTIRLFIRVLLYDTRPYNIRLAIVNLFGNILLFIPLGYFLPRLWTSLQKWWRTWLATLGIMLLVEVLQLFTLRGTCDVDDLILNLLGSALGYGIFRLLHAKKDR